MLKACIFDLDGVLVDTARYHYLSWKRVANKYGYDFDESQNESLKGISRMKSLELILNWGNINLSPNEKSAAANCKNEWYVEFVNGMSSDEIQPGVIEFLNELKANKIAIALGSASRNSMLCLSRIELLHYFDVIVDGNKVETAKPDPEVFLKAARELHLSPQSCVVFEDSKAGIEAANQGGFFSVGIGDKKNLNNANMVIPGFSGFRLELLQKVLSGN